MAVSPIPGPPPINPAANIPGLRTLSTTATTAVSAPRVFGTVAFAGTNYSLLSTDRYIQITAAGITLNLPAISGFIAAETIVIQDTSNGLYASPVTITPNGSDHINGTSTYSFTQNLGILRLHVTASGWEVELAVGNGGIATVAFPSYATASLPSASANTNTWARVTDYNKGVVVSNGTSWVSSIPTDTFRMEDFGAIGDGTTDCLPAWDAIQSAIPLTLTGFPNAGTSGARITFGPGKFFFSATPTLSVPCIVEGSGGYLTAPRTLLLSNYGQIGFIVSATAQSSIVRNLIISAAANQAPQWTASHAYTLGQWVQPKELGAQADAFTGYVFKCTGAGTSGSSQPSWPICNTFSTRTEVSGVVTVTDGGVTWTAYQQHGLVVNGDFCRFENIQTDYFLGDGWHIVGNVSQSTNADCCYFLLCHSFYNYGDGFYLQGNNAQVCTFQTCDAINNFGWGWNDRGQLGNVLIGCHTRSNGATPWIANSVQGAGVYLWGPTLQNGYIYEVSVGGTFGATEPVWPTTIGATVVSGTATFVCVRQQTGGPYNIINNSVLLLGCYSEEDQQPSYLAQNSNSLNGEQGAGFVTYAQAGADIGNNGWVTPIGVAQTGPLTTSLAVQTLSADTTYGVTSSIGGEALGNTLTAFGWGLTTVSNNAPVSGSQWQIEYAKSDGYWYLTNGGSSTDRAFGLPTAAASDGIGGPLTLPRGIRFGQGDTGIAFKSDYGPGGYYTSALLGDIIVDQNAVSSPLEGGFLGFQAVTGGTIVAGTASSTAVLNHTLLTHNFTGAVVDTLPPTQSTDLRLVFDDAIGSYDYQSVAFVDRTSQYVVTPIGGASRVYNCVQEQGQYTFHTTQGQNRRALYLANVTSCYWKLSSNSAQTIQSTDQLTIETVFTSTSAPSGGVVTLWGYKNVAGTCGYTLNLNTNGSLEFQIYNTASGNYVDLLSAASVVVGGVKTIYCVTLTIDMVNKIYAMYVNGTQVALVTTTTGTYTASNADIGLGGLLQNGTLTQPLYVQGLLEIVRSRRILSGAEVVARSAQINTANGGSLTTPPLNTDFCLENYGGGISASGAQNNQAWLNMWSAIQAVTPPNSYPNHYGSPKIRLYAGTYNFASQVDVPNTCVIEGAGGTYSSTTILSFPLGSKGMVFDYTNTVDGAYSVGSNFAVQAAYNTLLGWQANTVYTVGQCIRSNIWNGYTMVCSTGGTSGATEPTWTNSITYFQGNDPIDGTTIAEGGGSAVVWTYVLTVGFCFNSPAFLYNCTAAYWFGNGFHASASVSTRNSNDGSLINCWSVANAGNGFYWAGTDANGWSIYGSNAQSNGLVGFNDSSFLGNEFTDVSPATNGFGPWSPSTALTTIQNPGPLRFESRLACVPSNNPVQGFAGGQTAITTTQFYYTTTSSGSAVTGATEPVWPTTIGATVTDNGITWTCAGPNVSGAFLFRDANSSGSLKGYYHEVDQQPFLASAGVIVIGAGGLASPIQCRFITTGNQNGFFGVTNPNDSTYKVITNIGEAPGGTNSALTIQMITKSSNTIEDTWRYNYNTGAFPGCLVFRNDNTDGETAFAIPGNLSALGPQAPILLPNGWCISNASTGITSPKHTANYNGPPTSGTYAYGDVVENCASGHVIVGQYQAYRCITAGTPGTFVGDGLVPDTTSPIIDLLAPTATTDLHFVSNDFLSVNPSTIPSGTVWSSQIGSYAATVIGGTVQIEASGAPGNGNPIRFTDGRRKNFLAADSGNLSLPGANANTIQTTDQFTWHFAVQCDSVTSNETLAGYLNVAGTCGWRLDRIITTGIVHFRIINTSGTYYVDVASPSIVTGNHLITIIGDMVNSRFYMLIDGVIVTTVTSTTGSYTASNGAIGITCALQNGTALQSTQNFLLYEWMRERSIRSVQQIYWLGVPYIIAAGNTPSTQAVGTATSYSVVGYETYIGVTSTAATRTITLLPANLYADGDRITIKDESNGAATNNITVTQHSGDTIDFSTISTNNGLLALEKRGGGWWTVAKF